jgi:hypothetical protein
MPSEIVAEKYTIEFEVGLDDKQRCSLWHAETDRAGYDYWSLALWGTPQEVEKYCEAQGINVQHC